MCDQSVHEKCLTEAQSSDLLQRTGQFGCDECIKCHFCKIELPVVTDIALGHWLDNTERLCEKCSSTYEREGDGCGLCRKNYDGEYVMCEYCESWHCLPCSGFTQEQLDSIEDYICLSC